MLSLNKESINSHINKQEELVTQTFIPKPINGNCCLDVIDEKFQYNNELMKTKEIRDLHELVNKCSSKPGPNNYKIIERRKDL